MKRITPSLAAVCVLLLAVLACGGESAPTAANTPESLFSTQPGPAESSPQPPVSPGQPGTVPGSASQPAAGAQFTVSVIVDAATRQVTREQAQARVGEASGYQTPFTPYGLLMVDFSTDGNGGSMADLAARYIAARSAFLPNGLIIFSAGDNGRARSEGGYGFGLPVQGLRNSFVSPALGAGQIYVAVVDPAYRYMACGYGGGDQVTSASSLPGECNGTAGVACVQNNTYSMCSTAVGHLYTSTPTHAVASMIVHGLLHNFGPNGDQDHYSTPECTARLGYPAGFYDLQEAQYHNDLCPFVYDEFTKGYQP